MSPEQFFTKQQLERYNYAVALGNKLKQYQEQGCYLVDEGNIVKDWSVTIREDFDSNSWDVVYWSVGNCSFVIVDLSWYDDGRQYIATKKEIKEAFNSLRIVDPKHIKKF